MPFVNANGQRFYYEEAGSGPLVLLLHGFPQTSRCWRHQLPALAAAGFRAVAPDLRGYGRSSRPSGRAAYRTDVLTADVAGLIEALGAPAFVVGHDWGGALAWCLAMTRPELVKKLIVINCPHPSVMKRHLLTNPRQLLRSWYIFFFQLPWLPERMLPHVIAKLFKGEDRRRYLEGVHSEALNYYRAARFPQDRPLIMPVRLIWGEKDEALGAEMAVGPYDIVRLPDASHWVVDEKPDLVNRLLVEFLRD